MLVYVTEDSDLIDELEKLTRSLIENIINQSPVIGNIDHRLVREIRENVFTIEDLKKQRDY